MSAQPQTQNGPDLTGGIRASSLAEGVPLLGHVQGEPVILVRRGAEVFAIGATCSHYGGPLADGLVVDDTVRCPWHHACFSLRTGEALCAPALSPVAGYEIVQRAGQVLVTGKRAKQRSVRPGARPGTAATRSVAIVGAGAAGNSAAEELRHLGFEGGITLIDRDQEAPYDRPNLQRLLTHRRACWLRRSASSIGLGRFTGQALRPGQRVALAHAHTDARLGKGA